MKSGIRRGRGPSALDLTRAAVHAGAAMAEIFTCPFCHLRFPNRDEFVDHLKREHPDRYKPTEPTS